MAAAPSRRGVDVSERPQPRVHDSWIGLPEGRRVVTIGTFDGVHLGHRALLAQAIERGRKLGLPVSAVTFEPVPASVLRPDRFLGRICTALEKVDQLALAGLDEIVIIRFDHELARQSAEWFMTELSSHLSVVELWIGQGFALGRDRAGGIEQLMEIGAGLGFSVHPVQRRDIDGEIISSSAIRSLIQAGAVETVEPRLGRPFRIRGEVVPGARLGRTIGYPTANVVPPLGLVALPDGIYASLATIGDEAPVHQAMTYIGTRPTVNTGVRLIETHLLDFDRDIYGQDLVVDFVAHLRGDATFDGLESLVAQLKRDEASTRQTLSRHERGSTTDVGLTLDQPP